MHVINQRDHLLYSCDNLLYDTTSSTVLLLTPRGARQNFNPDFGRFLRLLGLPQSENVNARSFHNSGVLEISDGAPESPTLVIINSELGELK